MSQAPEPLASTDALTHDDFERRALRGRATFDAAALVAAPPPRLSHPNKTFLYELVGSSRPPAAGELVVSRWSALPPPGAPPAGPGPRLELREGGFTYEPPGAGRVAWHLNFADDQLFAFYGGPAFGQDEIQVAEHPALASLLGRLRADRPPGLEPLARDGGVATPVLVAGVERRAAIDTTPDLEAGRLYGLYGRRFQRASQPQIRSAVTRLDPPTRSNLVAMAALQGGAGAYTEAQIVDTLANAYAGFRAARVESARLAGPAAAVEVHTGHWGGGAFGGNRVLMAALQLFAARLAGLDALFFYAFDGQGEDDYRAALGALERALAAPAGGVATTAAAIAALVGMKFTWGSPDGN
jgi:hypothetical protein